MSAATQSLTFRTVLGVREFRWLWLANVQSLLGDQLARVAVSVLVYDATNSGLITSTVYALTFLPALVGAPLGVLADRLPRRALLVAGDVVRALLLCAMALPALPWPWLVPLVTLAVVVGAPWKAAEAALVADVLSGEGYVLGSGLRLATSQGAQLVGFAVGGAAVGLVGGHAALLVDAGTFAISAVLIRAGVAARPVAGHPVVDGAAAAPRLWAGVGVVCRSPRLRLLAAYAWLAGCFVVPEGLAAPVAARAGDGPPAVGLLLASMPLGLLVSSLTFVRWVPAGRRRQVMPALAAAAGLPLVCCLAAPGVVVVCGLWALTGAAMAYQLQAMTDFVQSCPDAVRGQAIAFASSGLLAAQGIGLVIGGAVAQAWSPFGAVAVAGLAGSGIALALALPRSRRAPAVATP